MDSDDVYRQEIERLRQELYRCANIMENAADDLDGGIRDRPGNPKHVAESLRALAVDVRSVRAVP